MSTRVVLVTAVTLAAVFMVVFTVSAQLTDPWFGTWKVNLEKSTYSSGPPPKSFTRTVEPSSGGLKEITDVVSAQNRTTHTETIATFDGTDSLVQGPPPAGAPTTARITRAYQRIDGRTYEFVNKVDGQVTTTIRTAHSVDGTTSMLRVTGINAQGETVNNTVVWDKQ
jgi:hypothetical protein